MSADRVRPDAAPAPPPTAAVPAPPPPGVTGVVRWLGRSAAGGWTALARRAPDGLALLEYPAAWAGGEPAPPPRVHDTVAPGLPIAAGTGLAADDPATGGLSRAALLDAVRAAAADQFTVLGDLPTAGGGLVYLALGAADDALHALQLEREPQPDGSVETVLAVYPQPAGGSPEGDAPAREAAGDAAAGRAPAVGAAKATGRGDTTEPAAAESAPAAGGPPPDSNIAPPPPAATTDPSPVGAVPRPTRTIAAPSFTALFGAAATPPATPTPPARPAADPAALAAGSKSCPQCDTVYPADVRFCPLDGATLRAASTGDDLVGQVVADRYHIERVLGEGGMGRVYLAEHVRMRRRSAVKVMGRALANDRDALSRFNREASNASRINHHHVAAIYDFGETADGLVYLAMEFVEGEPLTALLRREPVLGPGRAAILVAQVADGLDAAHALGIVHRDLKPDNIMVGQARMGGDWVKIVDFGIAKDARAGEQQVTRTGLVIGTPEYMSPEQLTAEPVDARSDVYSLALVAFVLLTGRLPFDATTTEQMLMARLLGTPKTLAEARPEELWPPELEAVMARALAKAPADRPATAGDFARELCEVVHGWVGLPAMPTGAAAMMTPVRVSPVDGTPPTGGARITPNATPALPPTLVAERPTAATAGSAGGAAAGASRRPLRLVAAAAIVVAVGAGGWLATRGGDAPAPAPDGRVADATPAAPPAPAPRADSAPAPAGPPPATRPLSAPGTMPSPAPASPAAPAPAAPRVTSAEARAELERVSRWTQFGVGDEASAQRALDALPALRRRLATAADSVEADYYAAMANGLLGRQAEACALFRRVEPRAVRAGYFVEAVQTALTACP